MNVTYPEFLRMTDEYRAEFFKKNADTDIVVTDIFVGQMIVFLAFVRDILGKLDLVSFSVQPNKEKRELMIKISRGGVL